MSRSWTMYLMLGAVMAVLVCSLVFAAEAEKEMKADAGAAGAADAADSGAADADADADAATPEEAPEPEVPMVLVHKSVSDYDIVPNQKVTVTVNVVNVGNGPAFDVKLSDKAPFVDEQKASVEELAAGANLTKSYEIVPQSVGHVDLPQAEVTYTLKAGDSEVKKATSNEVREEVRDEKTTNAEVGERGFVNVVTPEEFERMNSKKFKEYFFFLVFVVIAIALPMHLSKDKSKQISILLKEARKK